MLHHEELKKEKNKPKTSRRKKIMKISREEINEIENRKMTEKGNENESCFFEKIQQN